ncbi:ATP-dependent zinc metalloprotease FtsH [Aliarcobacter butzleri]|uniref:ATP-dependent zinc metalloprotease FtsH n=1 Tax=Aliarcobacter butzleri TaxID=28197 RepID=A0AAW6VDM6_9BACT|nr:ATP-dependent zinc metalloprotease FtsH [Aliarcobacter butzleri]MCP3648591.1 ATP-dependent zinc metalloprotease FtsH [Arcobacter sp. DNRA7]MCR1814764.1 ATP-dependent zinc metalloprotease FtsH [Aliarcobacter butzleri]MCT7561723.1 ATP-dependent zinc metalloprotease FtsH [Aliarcobacter butzleri]MCT7627656.1 ATP-dependent zinc metalloprotease FtsH [Aliarcobacter butzleri]MDK2040769.1 ATP-dependent zinc metalloprotease FtsH [Aliarcobacter butzleri]
MSKKQQQNDNNNINNNDNNNNFFNNNPILIFVIFAIVTIFAFKTIFSDETMGVSNSNVQAFGQSSNKTIAYSDLKKLISAGKIEYVGIGNTQIRAISKSEGGQVITYTARRVIPDETLITELEKNNIGYGGINEENILADILFGWVLPIFIFFAIWMFIAKRMQKSMGGGSGGILGIGSSKKMINSEKPNVKFDDMAGNKEAKEEVQEVVDFLKSPDRYVRLGAQIPKGVLLVGPPGTGKTLLAKAVAGEANVEFLSVSGSAFIEMFVGVGASRVRDLFEQAKKVAPAIIFIDEIDAIGKSRASGGPMGGNDEREQTLNQLLAEMDGFSTEHAPVIVLAATNRPEVLDPALLRPGRFDRQVLVDKPDYEGRIEILNVHIKDVKLGKNVDLKEVAKMTAGLAGADLANIVNEAALLAGRASKNEVGPEDFKEAVERQIAGLEKKSRRISPKERKIVAYHESGHALIAEITKGANKVNKVSIVPRGLAALGYTLNTPEENKYLMQKHELLAEVDVLLGGRAAEQVFIGEISTGAGNDLERATGIIKSMATIYGMSDIAGLMVLEKRTNQFLGGQTQKDYSDAMAKELDNHVKTILNERYEIVLQALKDNSAAIEQMTAELLDIEVITGERVREIIKENGGTVFEDEDLHSDAIKDEDIKEEKKTEEVKSQETETTKEVVEENNQDNLNNEDKPTQN